MPHLMINQRVTTQLLQMEIYIKLHLVPIDLVVTQFTLMVTEII